MPMVRLEFRMDGTLEEAWELAEGLEQAAMKKDFRAISAWAEEDDGGRRSVLGTEQSPVVSSAVAERPQTGDGPTQIGDPSADPEGGGPVTLRRYGQLD